MEFVHIYAQEFLAIMVVIQNFATSQAFATAHTVMAQRMNRIEAIHAQIQEHLGLPLIPFSPQAVVAPSSPTPPPVAPVVASEDPAPAVSVAALAALPADHPIIPTQSQDEDEVPPPTAT